MGNVLRCFCLPFKEPQYTILTSEETDIKKNTKMPYINNNEDCYGYTETTYFAKEDTIFDLDDERPEYDITYNTVYSRLYLQDRFHGWD